MKDRGHLISEAVEEAMRDFLMRPSLWPQPPLRPLTRWERRIAAFDRWRWGWRTRIHDWLFPEWKRSEWGD